MKAILETGVVDTTTTQCKYYILSTRLTLIKYLK